MPAIPRPAWLVAALFLLGCSGTAKVSLGHQCALDSECTEPLVCRFERCRTECLTVRDCPAEQTCVLQADGLGACRLEQESACAVDGDCGGGLRCLAGACTTLCADDGDCSAGARCLGAEGCVDITGSACGGDDDCAAGQGCHDGACRDECFGDGDCRAGASCRDAVCVAPPPDAGTTDAGPPPGRVQGGLLALYTFEEGEGSVVRDLSGVEPVVDLAIARPEDAVWGDGTLSVWVPNRIVSSSLADKISTAARETQEITVEAWVEPARRELAGLGPGRVVAMSADLDTANFVLGQGDPDDGVPNDLWSARLRTTDTGADGEPGLQSPASVFALALAHLVLVHGPAGTSLYVNGEVVHLRGGTGDLSAWVAAPLALANSPHDTVDRPFLGTYHLVAVYGRALGRDEVAQNLRAGP